MTISPKKALFLIAACAVPAGAWAHSGHGMSGTHWHATDAWGWLVAGAVAAAVFWLSRDRM